jgi:bis(5'-nucleosyl)-tetraphosphatase (symmetrical)
MGKERTIFIGDVHGCFDELMILMDKLSYDSDRDRLIFLGDLINKGPDSAKVLSWVFNEKAEVILGNHEYFGLKKGSLQRGALSSWVEWIRSWPLYIDEDEFLAVHAGVVPDYSLAQTPAEVLTRVRTWGNGRTHSHDDQRFPPWYELYQGDKLIVFGHWASRGLVQRENVIGLDTGCVYGNQLTAYILETKEIIQVEAKKAYEVIPS